MTDNDDISHFTYRYMIDRQNEAYFKFPKGKWFERWIPGVCEHKEIRCTHGDEILHRKMRRKVCMICGRALKGSIPNICFFTGLPHKEGFPND